MRPRKLTKTMLLRGVGSKPTRELKHVFLRIAMRRSYQMKIAMLLLAASFGTRVNAVATVTAKFGAKAGFPDGRYDLTYEYDRNGVQNGILLKQRLWGGPKGVDLQKGIGKPIYWGSPDVIDISIRQDKVIQFIL